MLAAGAAAADAVYSSLHNAELDREQGQTILDTLPQGAADTMENMLEMFGMTGKRCPNGYKLVTSKTAGSMTSYSCLMEGTDSGSAYTHPETEDDVHPPNGSLERKDPVLQHETNYPNVAHKDQNIPYWALLPAVSLLLLASLASLF